MTDFYYDPPTTNVDGSTIGTITKYEIGYGPASGNYTNFVSDTTLEAARQKTVVALPIGTSYSAVRAYAKDAAGTVTASAWSNEVKDVIASPVPSAPANFSHAS